MFLILALVQWINIESLKNRVIMNTEDIEWVKKLGYSLVRKKSEETRGKIELKNTRE